MLATQKQKTAAVSPLFSAYPKNLSLEITDRCNLKCSICVREDYEKLIGGPGTFMELEPLKKKMETAMMSAETIQINGFGETLLHPRLKELLDYIYSINSKNNLIKMITNGTALSKEKASWFQGHLASVHISVNAATAESYAKEMWPYQHNAGQDMRPKFHQLIERIRDFAEAFDESERKKIHLHYVVHRDNYTQMPEFVRLAHDLRLSTVAFTQYQVNREAFIDRSIYWIKEEYNDMIDEAMQVGQALGVCVNARKFFNEPQRDYIPERDCRWVNEESIIGVNGRMIPCCFIGEGQIGNIFEKQSDFEQIWFGEEYQKLRKKRYKPACLVCNEFKTFDDIDCHFHGYMKTNPQLKQKLEAFRHVDEKRFQVVNSFKNFNLDYNLYKKTFALLKSSLADHLPQDARTMELKDFRNLNERAWKIFSQKTDQSPQKQIYIDLFSGFHGVGWGMTESNIHGQRWRWLGHRDIPSSVFLYLQPHTSYAIKVHIHTAIQPHYLESFRAEANEMPLENAYIFQENGLFFYSAQLPEKIFQAHRSQPVRLSFYAGEPSKMTQRNELGMSLTSISIFSTPASSGTSFRDQTDSPIQRFLLARSVDYVHLDAMLQRLHGKLRVPLFGKLTMRYLQQKAWKLFQTSQSFSPLTIDLSAPFDGFGWSVAENNVHGQQWRWHCGHPVGASLFLKLSPVSDYQFKMLIHTATRDEFLTSLRVSLNDLPIERHYVQRQNGNLYHICEISKNALKKYRGLARLTYHTQPYNMRLAGIAFASCSIAPITLPDAPSPSSKSLKKWAQIFLSIFHVK